MNKYFYISGTEGQCGPITEEQLKDLHQSGVISDKTPLWCEGMKDWQPYGDVFSIWSKNFFDRHHNIAWLVAALLVGVCFFIYLISDAIAQKKREKEEAERRAELQSAEKYYRLRDWLESHR